MKNLSYKRAGWERSEGGLSTTIHLTLHILGSVFQRLCCVFL